MLHLAEIVQRQTARPAERGPYDGQLRAGQLRGFGDTYMAQIVRQLVAHEPRPVYGAAEEFARAPAPHPRLQAVPQPRLRLPCEIDRRC